MNVNTSITCSRNWCYDQWTILVNRNDTSFNLICRIAAAPLLLIATVFAEAAYLGSRIVSYLYGGTSFTATSPPPAKTAISLVKTLLTPEEEYSKLITLHQHLDQNLFLEAQKPKNQGRNRWSNVLPNEPTRVKIPDDPEFYFNANWVLGHKAIASQGPLPTEIAEFWNMVWRWDVKTLVMLANPIEGGRPKCSTYWLNGTYGKFTVHIESEKIVFTEGNLYCSRPKSLNFDSARQSKIEAKRPSKEDHSRIGKADEEDRFGKVGASQNSNFLADRSKNIIERTLKISEGSKNKIIKQYQLQNWPDFGVVSKEILAKLVKLVANETDLFLVHCSAGLGRTGTFLAAYQANKKKTADIYPIASDLRDPQKGRVGLIQTEEQYILASETANYLLTSLS